MKGNVEEIFQLPLGKQAPAESIGLWLMRIETLKKLSLKAD